MDNEVNMKMIVIHQKMAIKSACARVGAFD